jgi:hypothetical protein
MCKREKLSNSSQKSSPPEHPITSLFGTFYADAVPPVSSSQSAAARRHTAHYLDIELECKASNCRSFKTFLRAVAGRTDFLSLVGTHPRNLNTGYSRF